MFDLYAVYEDGVMTCDVASTYCFGIILHVPPGTPNMYIIAVIILMTILSRHITSEQH